MVSLGGEGAFPPGSTVEFVTALDATVRGEVVCFDPAVKALVIKDAVPGGKPILRLFNMAMIKEVKETAPAPEGRDSAESLLNHCQPSIEKNSADSEKRLRQELMDEDVPLEGQYAFVQLRRTLDDVRWKGPNISVLGRVLVKAPYTSESVEPIQNDDQAHSAVAHVKKILSKPFVPDHRLTACNDLKMLKDDDDVPILPADTLKLLEQFRKEQEERLKLESEGKVTIDEDWQLSQFWYSEETARTLCNEAIFACQGKGRVACLSSPTLMQYFHNMQECTSGDIELKVFEYDKRFGVRYPEEFVFYDYKEPLTIPDNLKGYFDVVVADPPFLSDECLVKTAQTIRLIGKKEAKIILCTGAIMEEVATRLLGVKRTSFSPQHTNNLANDFASFANYDPEYLK